MKTELALLLTHDSPTMTARGKTWFTAGITNEWREAMRRNLVAEMKAIRKARVRAALLMSRALYRNVRAVRTPPWADRKGIKRMYAEARRLTEATGIVHQVDHIIPLRGDMVSGLHVHNNLQILTGSENSKKRNRFEVEV